MKIIMGAKRSDVEIFFCKGFEGDFLTPDLVDEKYRNEWAPMARHLIGDQNPVNPGTAQAVPQSNNKKQNKETKMSQDYMKQIGLFASGESNSLRIYGNPEILALRKVERKKDKAPDFGIFLGGMRVGSVWNKISANGNKYKTGTIINHLDLEKEIRFVIFPAKEKGADHPVFLSQEFEQSADSAPSPSDNNEDSF